MPSFIGPKPLIFEVIISWRLDLSPYFKPAPKIRGCANFNGRALHCMGCGPKLRSIDESKASLRTQLGFGRYPNGTAQIYRAFKSKTEPCSKRDRENISVHKYRSNIPNR